VCVDGWMGVCVLVCPVCLCVCVCVCVHVYTYCSMNYYEKYVLLLHSLLPLPRRELVVERIARMLPSVIPDSCLTGTGMTEKWTQMVVNAFKRVGCETVSSII